MIIANGADKMIASHIQHRSSMDFAEALLEDQIVLNASMMEIEIAYNQAAAVTHLECMSSNLSC